MKKTVSVRRTRRMGGNRKCTDVFERIYDNYKYLNKMMVEEMEIASQHDGMTGDYREQMWMKLFRSIIPQKFAISQGVMIIDSDGRVSRQVDIAVYDEQYTPYVFQYNTLKFIPIEAVAIVIECKSNGFDRDALKLWAESIDSLVPQNIGIARIVSGYACGLTNTSQPSTRPIKILAAIKNSKTERASEGLKKELKDYFDIIILQKSKSFDLIIDNSDKHLGIWGDRLNGTEKNSENLKLEQTCKLSDEQKRLINEEHKDLFNTDYNFKATLENLQIEGNPLLSLNLMLNQLLMLINNPMLFPHYAYAKRFNEIGKAKKLNE